MSFFGKEDDAAAAAGASGTAGEGGRASAASAAAAAAGGGGAGGGGAQVSQPTGGKIDGMVLSLVEKANDGSPQVKKAVARALLDVGKRQPNLVLAACCEYIQKNSKLSRDHRISLLVTIYQILEVKRDEVVPELAVQLIRLSMAEMVAEPTVVADWQGAASNVLVSVGMRFPNQILDELLKRFPSGVIPHYFIVKTLGDFVMANAVETVPRLKEAIARVVPVLSSIKAENMKWVFAATLGHFCDAILTYVANIDRAADKSLNVSSFSSDIFPAYEVLFANWLTSAEAQVRLATLQAIGSMCQVISTEQLERNLERVVPAFINAYKKEKEHLPVTEGLNCLLDVGVKDGSRMLDSHLTVILSTVHALACIPPDSRNSNSVRNYNELFRCFQTLGTVFSDQMVMFFQEKLSHRDEKIRIGTLAIIRHLITHIVVELEDKKGLLVQAVKPLVMSESSYAVRRELAQVIIVMASHGYLHLEGGEGLVEFIVKSAAITDAECKAYAGSKQKAADASKPPELQCSPEELRSMSDNILNLITTTIEPMENVLWPFLFEFVGPREGRFNEALPVVCKCIGYLAEKRRAAEAADYIIDFDRAVNLPKPHAILARLLVAVSQPTRRADLAANVLGCLKAIGPVLHPSISDMWDTAIPKMLAFLESNDPSNARAWQAEGRQTTWEDLVRRLLAETIKLTADGDWTTALGQAYLEQLETGVHDAAAAPSGKSSGGSGAAGQVSASDQTAIRVAEPELKRVCFEHLGACLERGSHKEFIRTTVERVIALGQPSVEAERDGVAKGLGLCAGTHLDMTLEKIHAAISGPPQQKKKGGLFGFLSGGGSSKAANPEQMSPALILALGHVTERGPPELVTSRVEISVLNHLKPVMQAASLGKAGTGKPGSGLSNDDSKWCLMQTIERVARAVHPSKLPDDKKNFILKPRDSLLKQLVLFLTPGSGGGSSSGKDAGAGAGAAGAIPLRLKRAGLAAMTALVNLPPLLPVDLEKAVVERVNTFFAVTDDDDDTKALMADTHALLGSVLARQQASVACLVRQFECLEHYVKSSEGRQRARSCEGMLYLLRRYIDMKAQLMRLAAQKGKKEVIEPRFAALGPCVAMLLPRCGDPLPRVRAAAVEGIQRVLFIDAILQQFQARADDDVLSLDEASTARLAQFRPLKEQLTSDELELNERYAVVNEMAVILGGCVVAEELSALMQVSLHGLLDTQPTAAAATCVVLNGLVKSRGAELTGAVPALVAGVLARMPQISSEQAMNGTLHAVRSLATHHPLAVIDGILETAQLPHEPHVVKALQAVAKDEDLVGPFINRLLEILNSSQVYEEVLAGSGGGKDSSSSKRDSKSDGDGKKGGGDDGKAEADDGSAAAAATATQAMQRMSKVGVHLARSATCALGELLALPELEDIVRADREQFVRFLGTLLLRLGTANASATCPAPTDGGKAADEAITTLKAFLKAIGGDKNDLAKAVNAALESGGGWSRLKTSDYDKSIIALVAAVADQSGIALMRPLYDFLQPYLRGNFPEQRVVSQTVLAEFVQHCKKEGDEDTTALLALLVNAHLNGLADPVVKLQALRGLGNIVACGASYANQYATTVLDALLSSMDDPNEKLAMEAMTGLSKVFAIVSGERMATILVNICNRMRPAFDMHDNDDIREAAFRLTGSLARFGHCAVADAFFEQLMALLPLLAVHARDPCEDVSAAVLGALRSLAEEKLFRDEASGETGVDGVLLSFHTEADRFPDMFDYAEFLNDLAKAICAAYPERVNGLVMSCIDYFRSPVSELQCNACGMLGFLLNALPAEKRASSGINPGIVSTAVTNLLQSDVPAVRKAGAEAVALMWSY